MFNYQFPASPYTVDLKEMRGEYDAVPESKGQLTPPATSGWRTKLAYTLHRLAVKLAPDLGLLDVEAASTPRR